MAVKVREQPKGSGIYWLKIDHKGKRKSKKIGTDKKKAEQLAKILEGKIAAGDLGVLKEKTGESQVKTFGDYADMWSNLIIPATCKNSTIRDYRGHLKKHVLPVFNDRPIDKITRLDIKTFLTEKLSKGCSKSLTDTLKSIFGGIFTLAIDEGIITSNPTYKIQYTKKETNIKRYKINPYSAEELDLLLQTFKKHRPNHFPLALTLSRTGMRIGEALALQWSDIDFHNRLIHIQRNWTHSVLEQSTKTGKDRKIDMSLQLTETLHKWRIHKKERALKEGRSEIFQWVFPSKAGTPQDSPNWKNRVLNKMIEKSGLRKIRTHDLRHTFATLLIQNGESLAYIRDQLGHSSIQVTVDVYGHLVPGGNKSAVDRLDNQTRNQYATYTQLDKEAI